MKKKIQELFADEVKRPLAREDLADVPCILWRVQRNIPVILKCKYRRRHQSSPPLLQLETPRGVRMCCSVTSASPDGSRSPRHEGRCLRKLPTSEMLRRHWGAARGAFDELQEMRDRPRYQRQKNTPPNQDSAQNSSSVGEMWKKWWANKAWQSSAHFNPAFMLFTGGPGRTGSAHRRLIRLFAFFPTEHSHFISCYCQQTQERFSNSSATTNMNASHLLSYIKWAQLTLKWDPWEVLAAQLAWIAPLFSP